MVKKKTTTRKKNFGSHVRLSEEDQELRKKEYWDNVREKEKEYALLKEGRKTIHVSSQDQLDIGMLSSGWEGFLKKDLKLNFKKSRDRGYTKADDISGFWNQIGFKTSSGKLWTPKLVNIAKDKIGIKHGKTIVYR